MNKKIVCDFGFRMTKILPPCETEQEIGARVRMIPTAIGQVGQHNLAAHLGHLFEMATGIDGSFSAGAYAVKYGGIPTNRQDRGWFEDPAFLKMFYAAMVEGGVQHGDVIDLVLCIPIDDQGFAGKIHTLLSGPHAFRLRGQSTAHFVVDSVFVTLQGISSFFHFAFDLAGHWRVTCEDDRVYGLEVGGNTLHEVLFDSLADLREATKTHYNLGFWQVIHLMDDYLKTELGVSLPLLQVADIVEQRKIFLGRDIDLTPVIEMFAMRLVKEHLDLISARDLRMCRHLFVAGGTGEAFFSAYQAMDARFQLLPLAQYANAIGALKYSNFCAL